MLPGEHGVIGSPAGVFEAFKRADAPHGWFSFERGGVHFVSLVNVFDFEIDGKLGAERIDFALADLAAQKGETARRARLPDRRGDRRNGVGRGPAARGIDDISAAPPLARALRAALLFRQRSLDARTLAPDLFTAAVARCDAADRTYRDAVTATLPPGAAAQMLDVTKAFRALVHEIRSGARAEIAALLRGAPVEFDPLDVVAPRIDGLSHVDGVRLADASDRGRQRVAALRAEANARIAPLLDDAARERLVAAKSRRAVAFAGAIHAEVTPLGPTVERLSPTVEALAALADGWY